MSATSCLRYFMEDLFFGCSALCCFKLFPKTHVQEHKIFTVRAVVVSVITIVWWYFAEIYVISNNFFINILMQTQKLFVFVLRFKCCYSINFSYHRALYCRNVKSILLHSKIKFRDELMYICMLYNIIRK